MWRACELGSELCAFSISHRQLAAKKIKDQQYLKRLWHMKAWQQRVSALYCKRIACTDANCEKVSPLYMS